MNRVMLYCLALLPLAMSAHAETVPGQIEVQDQLLYTVHQAAVFGSTPVALLSTDRTDVLQAIAGMTSQLSSYSTTPPQTGITAAVDSFTQHWDLVITTSAEQTLNTAQSLMGDLMQRNSQSIDDFLNAPQIQPEKSIFLDPTFIQVLTPPAAGFFAP